MSIFSFFKNKNNQIDILENFPEGILVLNSDYNVIRSNHIAQEYLANSESELKSQNFLDLFDSTINPLDKMSQTNESIILKGKNEQNNELYFEIKAKFNELKNTYVVTFRDVTKSHKMMTKILVEYESNKKVNKDKNFFLTKLSTDLKSPLHSIIGFSQAVLEGLSGNVNEKQSKYLNIINKNASELLDLLDKIIELSKIESNLYEFDFKSFDFVNALNSVLEEFQPKLKEKNLQINLDTEKIYRRACYSDEIVVKKIISNLIENALRFTDIGQIGIRVYNPTLELLEKLGIEIPEGCGEKSFIAFCVTDTGAGFSKAELATVFDPYAQLEKNNKRQLLKGLSLGISKQFVKNLKGIIWAESELMQGSTFSFIIPS